MRMQMGKHRNLVWYLNLRHFSTCRARKDRDRWLFLFFANHDRSFCGSARWCCFLCQMAQWGRASLVRACSSGSTVRVRLHVPYSYSQQRTCEYVAYVIISEKPNGTVARTVQDTRHPTVHAVENSRNEGRSVSYCNSKANHSKPCTLEHNIVLCLWCINTVKCKGVEREAQKQPNTKNITSKLVRH